MRNKEIKERRDIALIERVRDTTPIVILFSIRTNRDTRVIELLIEMKGEIRKSREKEVIKRVKRGGRFLRVNTR